MWVLLHNFTWAMEITRSDGVSVLSLALTGLVYSTCVLEPLPSGRNKQVWASPWTQKEEERHMSRQSP